MPTIPAIDFPINLHPDWMGTLVQSCPDISLGDMVIPGSHDSGSYSIESYKAFSAVGRTQNISVVDQLYRGVRFLDLRLAESGKDVNVFHGCLQGTKFERVAEEVDLFCEDFPGEFVIIEVVAEYGRSFCSASKLKALEILKESLREKMFTEDNKEKLMSTPVKELVMNKKQVCVLLHPRFFEGLEIDGQAATPDIINEKYGCVDSGKWMQNQW
jgi:hypothetical protein